MRRRRPTRLRLKVDHAATAAMSFKDKDSYVHLDGRHIYEGEDARDAYAQAYADWAHSGRKCGLCGFYVEQWDEDWEHIKSKGLHPRDDHPRNRQFSHHACHMKAHNREPRWSKTNHAPDCQMSKPLGADGATCNCGLFRRVFGAKENTNA